MNAPIATRITSTGHHDGADDGLLLTFLLSAAFLLMASHTKGSQAMLAVSTLSQGIGYLAAGAGPFIFGRLLQATGGWTAPFVFFTAVILLWGLCVRLADTRQTVD